MVATHIWYRRNPNSYSVAADNILIIALKTSFLSLLLSFGLSFWSCFSAVIFGPSVVSSHSASTALCSNPTPGPLNTDSWISLPTVPPSPCLLLLIVSLKLEEEQAGMHQRTCSLGSSSLWSLYPLVFQFFIPVFHSSLS